MTNDRSASSHPIPAAAAVLVDGLRASLGGEDWEAASATDQPTVYVAPHRLVETCRHLRDERALGFDLLADLTAVDYWPREPRFEIVYHLASLAHQRRLRLKVRVAGGGPEVPTVGAVWRSAGWLEREVWDLFGIVFTDHPDLRRLLMPDDWDGHPLRKDYPVQIKLAATVAEPLQVTEEEFKARLEADRQARTRRG